MRKKKDNKMSEKEEGPKPPPINIYFDCETYTTKRFKHVPYLVCLKDESGTTSFKSKHVFKEMLDHLAHKYGSENSVIICLL